MKGLCPRPLDDGDLDFGAGNEARTRDINLGKVALYQLSYSRAVRISILMNFQTLSSFYSLFFVSAWWERRDSNSGPTD